ncbi:MAG TPA: MDR family MFS transporter [Phycicoccus sp.]|nr:MDR family MFS transporter [Phycicoccus sp.]HQH06218.1 MDR family MFS transporter [Phycicoccus sp.]HQK30274.1 MDR family MFS transporter [Phycicoccus sp.]HQY95637.1 MDR family MFS transporter [Phycicoccus sp.]HRA43728.1 MDR family MFS transporter [Phycicoccus sp.]
MTVSSPAPFTLSPEHKRVFAGLMLGMFVASISQMIVSPAMPRIVAELGGMDHYSWVAIAAMLVSAVTVPIVGKLSDLYGRRGFYIAGLAVFMAGSIVAGFAQSFGILILGRAIQGFGMGTLMPLSQTIIGDIIPARQRGKYQGIMGSVFGLSSVAGPITGGWITDHFGWRALFFVSLPVGLVALFFIARFLHLPFQRRDAKVDVAGIVLLAVGLTTSLLATSWGGTTYAWSSGTILGLYAVGVVALIAFVWVETKAEEPVLPLRLFKSSVFSFSVIASFIIAMAMFGAMIYIPVFAQGVVGINATNSGLVLMPMMVGMIVLGIVSGALVTRTGRYKEIMLLGVAIMGVGQWLLSRMDHTATQTQLTVAMIVFGIGLGMAMQLYTLVVQNGAEQRDMGVATASTQFFRNVGSTVGIAIFGTVMTSGLAAAIMGHLPAEVAAQMAAGGGSGMSAGDVLDPSKLAALPPVVADAVRQGLAERLHVVFLLGIPLLALAFLVTLFIKHVPLRETVHAHEDAKTHDVEDFGHDLLDTMSSTVGEASAPVGHASGSTPAGQRVSVTSDS